MLPFSQRRMKTSGTPGRQTVSCPFKWIFIRHLFKGKGQDDKKACWWPPQPVPYYHSLLLTPRSRCAKPESPQMTQAQPPWREVSSLSSFGETSPHKYLVETLLTILHCFLLGRRDGIILSSIILHLQPWLLPSAWLVDPSCLRSL